MHVVSLIVRIRLPLVSSQSYQYQKSYGCFSYSDVVGRARSLVKWSIWRTISSTTEAIEMSSNDRAQGCIVKIGNPVLLEPVCRFGEPQEEEGFDNHQTRWSGRGRMTQTSWCIWLSLYRHWHVYHCLFDRKCLRCYTCRPHLRTHVLLHMRAYLLLAICSSHTTWTSAERTGTHAEAHAPKYCCYVTIFCSLSTLCCTVLVRHYIVQ